MGRAVMAALRAAVVAASCWAAVGAPSAGAEEQQEKAKAKDEVRVNPFVADKLNRTVVVHDLTLKEVQRYALTAKKSYSVVLLVNHAPEDQEKKCRSRSYCAWLDKQFEALAEGYTQQLRNQQVYEPLGQRLFFARLYTDQTKKLLKTLELTHFPAVTLLRPRGAAAVPFGRSELRLEVPGAQDVKAAAGRKEAAKRPSLKRAVRRAERRRRQVSTQEEKEERGQGLRDYQRTSMRNLCKWLKIHTGQMMAHCPQDVDTDIVSKQSKSETGKRILVGVFGLSSFLYLARVFEIVLAPVRPSEEDLRRAQIIAAGVRDHSESHVAFKAVDPWWRFHTMVAALLCICFVACCASGMYYNFLHKRPILGDDVKAPLARLTGYRKTLPYPFHFSTTLAGTVAVSALSLIALGRAATINHFAVKLAVVFACLAVWASTGLAVLNWFQERNHPYLRGTPMWPYLELAKKLA